MALVNRDKDASEQKDVVVSRLVTVVTGTTLLLHKLPYPAVLQSLAGAVTGISNSPIISFYKVASTGITLEAIGISGYLPLDVGSTGHVAGFSGLAASGSTLLNFAAGDYLMCTATGSNAAAVSVVLEMVFKKTADIVAHNGVSA